MKVNRLLPVLTILLAMATTAPAAEPPRLLAWDDLIVKLAPGENPFATLSMDQLEALADVAGLRDRKARGVALTAPEIATEKASAEKLKQSGIDVDALLARREEIAEKNRKLASALNTSLDGKTVRLAGYMLPLEFSGRQVTAFLLVPWVGACIHTPPPPANQIVHVKPERPVDIKGVFDAIWVTGRIAASERRQSVYITDGTTDIDVGYAIRASQVEPYR